MNMPEFPKEFVQKHCLKVMEARDWRKNFCLPPDPEDDEAYAECAFEKAGCGLQCENCKTYLHSVNDGIENARDKFYPAIKKFYDDFEAYEKWLKETQHESGAFI